MADDPFRNLPIEAIEDINRMVRISRQMLRELGREATPAELASRMGKPVDQVRLWLSIAKEPPPAANEC